VALYPASQEVGIDFDWLDKRSMDPVGYKRVNKRTGQDIQGDDIVKGIRQDDGQYVILSEEQIKAAYPKSTQTIEIESFVKASEIAFTLLETPYYLEPLGQGQKVYALLRESMFEAGVIGIARVVMHSKEHLAALIPSGPALVLNTIRWAGEIHPLAELTLPAEGKAAAGLKPEEMKMAAQLIGDMTGPWKSHEYSDKFSAAILALVKKKVEAGETATVTTLEAATSQAAVTNVVDLTELLVKSLARRKGASSADAGTSSVAVAVKKASAKASTRRRA
jgi:DNA end-binding protein Ku